MATAVAMVAVAVAMAMARAAKTAVTVMMAAVELAPAMAVMMAPMAAYLRNREGSTGAGRCVSSVRRAIRGMRRGGLGRAHRSPRRPERMSTGRPATG